MRAICVIRTRTETARSVGELRNTSAVSESGDDPLTKRRRLLAARQRDISHTLMCVYSLRVAAVAALYRLPVTWIGTTGVAAVAYEAVIHWLHEFNKISG